MRDSHVGCIYFYSRKDSDFARKLTNSLAELGRDVWVDWEDIARGADWLHENYAGIEAADTFVFIVSQHSLTSEICNKEILHARQHNKRIIPLILQEISGDVETTVKGNWFDQQFVFSTYPLPSFLHFRIRFDCKSLCI